MEAIKNASIVLKDSLAHWIEHKRKYNVEGEIYIDFDIR